MKIFIDILFLIFGSLVGIFCLGQLFHIIFFSIPFTNKLNKLKVLYPSNPILRRYVIGLILWILIFAVITFLVFRFAQFSNKLGYIIGAIIFFFPASGITKWQDKIKSYLTVFDEYIDKDALNNAAKGQ